MTVAQSIRRLRDASLREVASTRTLISAPAPIVARVSLDEAAAAAIAGPLTDDLMIRRGLETMMPLTPPAHAG